MSEQPEGSERPDAPEAADGREDACGVGPVERAPVDGEVRTEELLAAAERRVQEEGLQVVRTPESDRRLAVVWAPHEPSGRGRPARFTRGDVVDAGLALAGESGLEALSMRKVAQRLGVGVMSLYTHVPGRTELIDLMVDRVYGGLDLPDGSEPTWREGLRRWALAMVGLYVQHPWLTEVNSWRLPITPHVLDAQEAQIRALMGTGADPVWAARTADWLSAAVVGIGRTRADEILDRRRTGMTNEDYWNSLAAYWEDYFQPERYPTMMRIWLAGGYDSPLSGSTEVGEVERLLDTVEREHTASLEGDDGARSGKPG